MSSVAPDNSEQISDILLALANNSRHSFYEYRNLSLRDFLRWFETRRESYWASVLPIERDYLNVYRPDLEAGKATIGEIVDMESRPINCGQLGIKIDHIRPLRDNCCVILLATPRAFGDFAATIRKK